MSIYLRHSAAAQAMQTVHPDPTHAGAVAPSTVASHSRFFQRLHRRYADQLPLLPPGPPLHETLEQALQQLIGQGNDLGAAMRILRQLVLERLAVLDCDAGASLQDVTACMTHLAELALDFAANHLQPEGAFLVKVFQGSGFAEYVVAMRQIFRKVVTRKPDASRGRSSELYLLGQGLK